MAKHERIATGEYRVRFAAYCGMSYTLAEHCDRAEARSVLGRLLRRRKKTGHPIAILQAGTEYECQEPAGCAMVPDTAGIAFIEPEYRPAVRCWECDSLVPIGECCRECEDRAAEPETEETEGQED